MKENKEEEFENVEVTDQKGGFTYVNETEGTAVEETQEIAVKGFDMVGNRGKTKYEVRTTLTDNKKIFNLDDSCDYKLNDCKGEKIRVVDVLIKIFEKELEGEDVIFNEETGEVLKDKEVKMITILIDEAGKTYVTASKMFGIKVMNFIRDFGVEEITKGLDIEITEKAVKNSNNKALSFKLI